MSSTNQGKILHPTRIDLSVETRLGVIELLNQTLAFTLDLKTQVKQAHWNVKGLDFYQLHLLFDELAGELEEYIDLVAERITALGGVAMGTVRVAAQVSQLPEYPFDVLDGKSHIVALADRYAVYGKLLRDGIAKTDELNDADTADLYTEISRGIDMRLWFLEAHLQGEAVSANTGRSNGAAKSAKLAAKTVETKATRAKAATKSTAKTIAKTEPKTSKAAEKTTSKKPKTKAKS